MNESKELDKKDGDVNIVNEHSTEVLCSVIIYPYKVSPSDEGLNI